MSIEDKPFPKLITDSDTKLIGFYSPVHQEHADADCIDGGAGFGREAQNSLSEFGVLRRQ